MSSGALVRLVSHLLCFPSAQLSVAKCPSQAPVLLEWAVPGSMAPLTPALQGEKGKTYGGAEQSWCLGISLPG